MLRISFLKRTHIPLEAIFLSPSEYNVKTLNKRIILDLVRFTAGGISRADLARRMGLTRAAVTSIINDLLAEKLVREAENGPATGGRRPILLEINPKRGYLIGIDMGATHLGMVITDFSAQILSDMEVPFDVTLGPQKCLAIMDEHLQKCVNAVGINRNELVAVGLGVPGPVVFDTGIVSAPPIMPGWDCYPIRDHLKEIWGIPIALGNDAEYGALGEWAYGAGRGTNNLVYIKVGTGVGAGLLLDGHIYRGATGSAGEIGHITIKEHGPRCSCGSYGCLEALAGGLAIARKAREAVESGRRTQLSAIDFESISAKDVAVAARLGDLVAQQIVTEVGGYIGIAVADLINLVNPGMIVIGGAVSQMGDMLLEPIRKVVRERSLRVSAQNVRITTAILGRRSSSMGAIVQVLNAVLDEIIHI
jgi:glucokinase-like ROK family protein